jgi:hypothetical protein
MVRYFAILAVTALGCLWIFPGRAQHSGSAADAPAAAPVDPAGTSSGISQGDCNCTLPKGGVIYTLGKDVSFKFTCGVPCTLQLQAMVEAGGNKAAGNQWAISGQLDGKPDGFDAPFQGTLPTDASSVTGNFAWSVSLTKGTYTAQPTVFVKGPAMLGDFHITYQVSQL